MAAPYKSKFTGKQIDDLLAIIQEKQDILKDMSVTKEGDLMYKGYPVVLDIPEIEEQTEE
jgi:hypothetical protein